MSVTGAPLQRVRLQYEKGEPVRYISHLDMMRLWERAFRRLDLPVAHSHGFNPRPRMGMACPLPTGVTGRAEFLDVFLTRRVDVARTVKELNSTLPEGVRIVRGWEVAMRGPALMAMRGAAEYHAHVTWGGSAEALETKLRNWAAQSTVVRERRKKGRASTYDLRPLVERLWVVGRGPEGWTIGMRLKAEPSATGRPDEVLKSLGLWEGATGIERTALVLEGLAFLPAAANSDDSR